MHNFFTSSSISAVSLLTICDSRGKIGVGFGWLFIFLHWCFLVLRYSVCFVSIWCVYLYLVQCSSQLFVFWFERSCRIGLVHFIPSFYDILSSLADMGELEPLFVGTVTTLQALVAFNASVCSDLAVCLSCVCLVLFHISMLVIPMDFTEYLTFSVVLSGYIASSLDTV